MSGLVAWYPHAVLWQLKSPSEMHDGEKMGISLLLRTLTGDLYTLMTVVPSTSTAVQFSIESAAQVAAIFLLEPFLTEAAVP